MGNHCCHGYALELGRESGGESKDVVDDDVRLRLPYRRPSEVDPSLYSLVGRERISMGRENGELGRSNKLHSNIVNG
jgi:hypothetical protein